MRLCVSRDGGVVISAPEDEGCARDGRGPHSLQQDDTERERRKDGEHDVKIEIVGLAARVSDLARKDGFVP